MLAYLGDGIDVQHTARVEVFRFRFFGGDAGKGAGGVDCSEGGGGVSWRNGMVNW